MARYVDECRAAARMSEGRRLQPTPWEYEVHELSEGYSAIIYDADGVAVADHLQEEQAKQIVEWVNAASAVRTKSMVEGK